MDIHNIEFKGSFTELGQCPEENLPEYAFIGRSNVGKSSLINMLCGRKNLAHTSKKPGKTQTMNFFLVDRTWYLVDLPGYGYAKISKRQRAQWQRMIDSYFKNRLSLQCAFVLIDVNISPQQKDLDFVDRLGELRVPFVLVYTKCDRSKENKLAENIAAFKEAMLEKWDSMPEQFMSSAVSGRGREELLSFIEDINSKTFSREIE